MVFLHLLVYDAVNLIPKVNKVVTDLLLVLGQGRYPHVLEYPLEFILKIRAVDKLIDINELGLICVVQANRVNLWNTCLLVKNLCEEVATRCSTTTSGVRPYTEQVVYIGLSLDRVDL